jgi:hypothetical protein
VKKILLYFFVAFLIFQLNKQQLSIYYDIKVFNLGIGSFEFKKSKFIDCTLPNDMGDYVYEYELDVPKKAVDSVKFAQNQFRFPIDSFHTATNFYDKLSIQNAMLFKNPVAYEINGTTLLYLPDSGKIYYRVEHF